jgi:phage terminase small subunit
MFAKHDETKLFCVAYIIYTDDVATIRQTGFCRQYDPETHRWTSVNDPEYEYSY